LLNDSGRATLPPPTRQKTAGAASLSNLRILLLAALPGEGPVTEPTAPAQTWQPELVFMPPKRHSWAQPASSGHSINIGDVGAPRLDMIAISRSK
jgi:hypothetical protein